MCSSHPRKEGGQNHRTKSGVPRADEPTFQDLVEATDGLVDGHKLAGLAGEDLGHLEGLGEKTLDLAGPGHRQLVLLRQLVHAQDGNDVLQRLVVLPEKTQAHVVRLHSCSGDD